MNHQNERKIKSDEKIFDYPFIRYSRALIDSPDFSHISIEARTLLAMILDRHGLSTINSERFTDENGGIYVIYMVEEICEKLGCGKARALRLFRELESNGMISRKRKNGCKPSRIHITPLFLNGLKQDFAKSENKTLQSRKTEPCKVSESADSYNNKSNNELSNNNQSFVGFGRTEEEIREQIEYDCLVCESNKNLLDEIVMIISDVLNGTSPTVRIGRDDMPRGIVISRFCRLDSEHICYVLSGLENNTNKIRSIKSYLITMLYNAPATMESEVTALFSYYH